MNTKDTNPKDAVGCRKPPLSVLPCGPLYMVAAALLDGACKYGRHNYRTAGVRASIYYDAAMRHEMAFWEGEDADPDSGLHPIAHAIADLLILLDSQMNGNWNDDRPPRPRAWMGDVRKAVEQILDRYPNPKEPHTEAASNGQGTDR